MSKTVKIILAVCTTLVLLLVITVVAGYFVISHYGKGWMEAGERKMKDGAEFGVRTDNKGCLAEAIRRHRADDSITGSIGNNLFLRGCLESSRKTVNFCNGVPPESEFTKSIQWRLSKCRDENLNDSQCGQLFAQVQSYCDKLQKGDAKRLER